MPGRFAPTPSGRMHIGNIYAMLGAWLSARSRGDGMLLRIEDIDEPRVVPGAAELMIGRPALAWLGLGRRSRCSNPLGTTCTVRRCIAWKT